MIYTVPRAASGKPDEPAGSTGDNAVFLRRVLLTMLTPATRLARVFDVPVAELSEWVRLASFHEMRSRGLTVQQAATRLGVSAPTAARLSRQLKLFLAEAGEYELGKRIAFVLWTHPLSRPRLVQALSPIPAEEIDAALVQLVAEGRVHVEPGRTPIYSVARGEHRIVASGWQARIGALHSLLANVTDAVEQRFFRDSKRAFARTLTLRMRAEDAAELERFYEKTFWPFLRELEERAKDADEVETKRLSLVWASYDQTEEK